MTLYIKFLASKLHSLIILIFRSNGSTNTLITNIPISISESLRRVLEESSPETVVLGIVLLPYVTRDSGSLMHLSTIAYAKRKRRLTTIRMKRPSGFCTASHNDSGVSNTRRSDGRTSYPVLRRCRIAHRLAACMLTAHESSLDCGNRDTDKEKQREGSICLNSCRQLFQCSSITSFPLP